MFSEQEYEGNGEGEGEGAQPSSEPVVGDQGPDPSLPQDAPLGHNPDVPVAQSPPDPSTQSGIPDLPENKELIEEQRQGESEGDEGE